MPSLYCSNCQRHTPHRPHPTMYADQCTVCWALTSKLIRAQAETHTYAAPDGTAATVVENTPDRVTYHVPSGKYAGYYHYDKHTQAKTITQGGRS